MKQKVIFKSILVLLITVSCFFSEGINLLSKAEVLQKPPLYDISTNSLNLSNANENYLIEGSSISTQEKQSCNNIVVDGGVHTIILKNVNIDCGKLKKSAIDIKNGAVVKILLSGENNLKGGGGFDPSAYGFAAISVSTDSKLTIENYDNNIEGILNAKPGVGAACIGGNYGNSSGKIIINGGKITAISDGNGAGIGGGNNGEGGIITINDGNIYCKSRYGAGIGGGTYKTSGIITINGGNIDAQSSSSSPAIGAGYGGYAKKIVINGGNIKAIGGNSGGTGIGGTEINPSEKEKMCEEIIINGGNIYARGAASGIGACYGGSCKKIVINGGNINALGTFGAGIGGGGSYIANGEGGTIENIVITGGNIYAKSFYDNDGKLDENLKAQNIGKGCGTGSLTTIVNAENENVYLNKIELNEMKNTHKLESMDITDYNLENVKTLKIKDNPYSVGYEAICLYLPENEQFEKMVFENNDNYYFPEKGKLITKNEYKKAVFKKVSCKLTANIKNLESKNVDVKINSEVEFEKEGTTKYWYKEFNGKVYKIDNDNKNEYILPKNLKKGDYKYFCKFKYNGETFKSSNEINVTVTQSKVVKHTKNKSIIVYEEGGKNRYETSVNVAKKLTRNKIVNKIVLVCGENDFIVDGLTAAPFAKSMQKDDLIPVLLTNKNSIPDSVKKFILDKGIKEVYIIGGKNSVSEKIGIDLKTLGVLNINRISGKDRYKTAFKIADKIKQNLHQNKLRGVFIVGGHSEVDCLSISGIAAKKQYPIILVNEKNQNNIVDYLNKNIDKNHVYIIGGKNSVSSKIEKIIDSNIKNGNLIRIDGKDRFDTNVEIISALDDKKNTTILISRGDKNLLIDAICAGAYVGDINENTVLFLTDENGFNESQKTIIKNMKQDLKKVLIIGKQINKKDLTYVKTIK